MVKLRCHLVNICVCTTFTATGHRNQPSQVEVHTQQQATSLQQTYLAGSVHYGIIWPAPAQPQLYWQHKGLQNDHNVPHTVLGYKP
jgi:hypothetical protein